MTILSERPQDPGSLTVNEFFVAVLGDIQWELVVISNDTIQARILSRHPQQGLLWVDYQSFVYRGTLVEYLRGQLREARSTLIRQEQEASKIRHIQERRFTFVTACLFLKHYGPAGLPAKSTERARLTVTPSVLEVYNFVSEHWKVDWNEREPSVVDLTLVPVSSAFGVPQMDLERLTDREVRLTPEEPPHLVDTASPKLSTCVNCGLPGPHYVPPSMGERGFFTCKRKAQT